MKMTSIFSGALVASVLFASSAAMAAPQPNHNRVDVNMPKLEMRIDAGVKSGKLTQGEERVLRTELRQLGASVKAALKDHKVTKRERASLEGKEAALSKHITKLANNKEVVKKYEGKRDDKRDEHRPAPAKPDQGKKVQFEQNNGHQAPNAKR